MLAKRWRQVAASISIDQLRQGDITRTAARCERMEVRIELGALAHARVEAPGVYVVRVNLLGLGIARGACTIQLCVSTVRMEQAPTRRRSPPPSEATLAKMKDDPTMVAEFKLYQHAKEKF